MTPFLTRTTVCFATLGLFCTPAAALAAPAQDATQGFYLGLSGSLAAPTGKRAVSGELSGGAISIPFTGSVDQGTGVGVSVAAGFETALGGGDFPPVRLEAQYTGLRIRRDSISAGLLTVTPRDKISVDAGLANLRLRLLGNDRFGIWAGGGAGYAWISVPDAGKFAACGCLAPAKGKGLAYQVQLAGEYRLSGKTGLFVEAAATRLPGASVSGQGAPAMVYPAFWQPTASIGVRFSL